MERSNLEKNVLKLLDKERLNFPLVKIELKGVWNLYNSIEKIDLPMLVMMNDSEASLTEIGFSNLASIPMYFFWGKLNDPNISVDESIKITMDNFFKYECTRVSIGNYGWLKSHLINFIIDVILPEFKIKPRILQSIQTGKVYKKFMKRYQKTFLIDVVTEYIRDKDISDAEIIFLRLSKKVTRKYTCTNTEKNMTL